jgi:hypothetical protein
LLEGNLEIGKRGTCRKQLLLVSAGKVRPQEGLG